MADQADSLVVYHLGSDEVVAFASRELARYLRRMTGGRVAVRARRRYDAGAAGVWVGPREAFDEQQLTRAMRSAERDAETIQVTAGRGHAIVTGEQPRAVLFAAYRYLEALGCRWLRPGRHGERIPAVRKPLSRKVAIDETPSARHRVICIEGATSVEHAADLIDYAGKRGFNGYFIQFRNAFTFFDRWYGQERHRGRKRTRIPADEADRYRDQLKAAALQRGMVLHMVGHGWTCEPFGIAGEEWAATQQVVPEEVRPYLALIDGRRDLFRGVPLNTNLDYSRPEVRATMAEAVADYAQVHPDEAVIHVWLADGTNNHDEGEQSRQHLPSDWYVLILNEIDQCLARRGLETRIVFLAYVDLLWAPEAFRIENPDRFILMFAPITRTYTHAFLDPQQATDDERIPPYRLNQNEFPSSPQANLKMLAKWRAKFEGQCVNFDYHLWWNQHPVPAQLGLAKVLYKDVRDLKKMHMDGWISCQLQRVAFPTGLYLHVMGRTLWNDREAFGPMTRAYFQDVYGKLGQEVLAYMQRLDRLFDQETLRHDQTDEGAVARSIRRLKKVPAVVEGFMPTLEKGCAAADEVAAAQFKLLREHAWYVTAYADLYARILAHDPTAPEAYQTIERELDRRLPALHHVFDTWIAKGRMRNSLAIAGMEPPSPA